MSDDLELARVWADVAVRATQDRDAAIRKAHAKGLSLREIAAAVSLSHTGVKKIIDRQ